LDGSVVAVGVGVVVGEAVGDGLCVCDGASVGDGVWSEGDPSADAVTATPHETAVSIRTTSRSEAPLRFPPRGRFIARQALVPVQLKTYVGPQASCCLRLDPCVAPS
jgi:hypothetical protein